MTILAPEEFTDNKVEDIAIIDPNKIIINQEFENVVTKISDSEFEGTELDPYRQMGISGDTRAIYNDLLRCRSHNNG